MSNGDRIGVDIGYEDKTTYSREGCEIDCPYCGHVNKDLWEHDLDEEGTKDVACGECGKDFSLSKRITVSYTARAIE